MKVYQIILATIGFVIIVFAGFWYAHTHNTNKTNQQDTATNQSKSLNNLQEKMSETKFQIKSNVFNNNEEIPQKYSCDGENVNPPLIIENIPEGTKSLVLIVDDPDAPIGVFTHWILFNISPDTNFIDENSVPEGALQGINDFKKVEYDGPCPPHGTHRYYFRLYAINDLLNLQNGATRGDVEKAFQDKIIDETVLMGTYTR